MRLMLLFCWKQRPDVCLDVAVTCVCTIKLYHMFIQTLTFSFMPEPKVEANVLKVLSEELTALSKYPRPNPMSITKKFDIFCLFSSPFP